MKDSFMGKRLENPSFEQWLAYAFDHPVDEIKNAWYWDLDRDWWEETLQETIRFLTQAFENAEEVFKPFADAQLKQGLWFIADNSCSSHMFALMDESVPWSERQRCIRSFYQLYEQLFAKRCTPHLSHIDEPGASPLNVLCYMWWDIIPIAGRPHDPARKEFDQTILEVMDSTLQLDSIACRESALHGLGHWQHEYPEQVGDIINRFSMSHQNLRKELETYMKNAFVGYVL
jgi:hypothetical protein